MALLGRLVLCWSHMHMIHAPFALQETQLQQEAPKSEASAGHKSGDEARGRPVRLK